MIITALMLQYVFKQLWKTCPRMSMSMSTKSRTDKRTSTRMERKGWVKISDYEVYPWSLSGVETCVVLKHRDTKIAFDMGYSCRESVGCPHVFISHGHMDHASGIHQHACKRGLYTMKPAKYFIPEILHQPLHTVSKVYQDMAEIPFTVDLEAVGPSDKIELPGRKFVVPFPTVHRVVSQGYLLYQNVRTLKQEYRGLSGLEIGNLKKQGTDVYLTSIVPEVAYTGDTTFELFENPPNEDLLRVKLLITEMTYVHTKQNKDFVAMAKERGHIHLMDVARNAHLFDKVDNILFIHFSDRYNIHEIEEAVHKHLPESLRKKIYIAFLQGGAENIPIIKGF